LEAPPADHQCFTCKSAPGIYRCTDCIGEQLSCSGCCRRLHNLAPFHRIKRWNGTYFESSDLVTLGLVIHVGHGGRNCPSYDSGIGPEDMEDEWEDEDVEEATLPLDGADLLSGTLPESQTLWGPAVPGTHRIIVVSSTGIFRRRIRWCQCPGATDAHIQLLRLNLFSASISRPSTAFTFDVLDHFHIDAMECKTAALNFYNKLRRITNNAFPGTSPVSVPLYIGQSHN
jgi:hypothetical protein